MAVLFLLAWACCPAAQAQQTIYRCGQEYTNAPRDPQRCEPLASQAITVINGTRPVPAQPSPAPQGMASVPTRTPDVRQTERDAQARTILTQELDKARAQHAQLVQTYNQGAPEKWATESRNHQMYLDRVAALKAAIDRTERDIESLQRELERHPSRLSQRTP